MYEWVGAYAGPLQPLVVAAQQLAGGARSTYTRTDPHATRVALHPLLAAIFPGQWSAAYVVVVWPQGLIPLHVDDGTATCQGTRSHLVVQTNAGAWSFHDGLWQHLDEGGIYRGDPAREHAAVNLGTTPRIHVMVDVL